MTLKVDTTLYIRELLFGHDCVIVPGFGGFIGNYAPARIDKATGLFSPPSKQISFNKNLSHNDGLLIGRISEAVGTDFNETRTNVAKYVAELRRKLDSGETVVFEHIGTFVNNREGNVQFEPDRTANYCLDSFGLESFQCFPLGENEARTRVINPVDDDSVRKVHMRKMMWRAAVAVPLLALLVAAPFQTNLFKPKVETSTLNPLAAAEFEHNKAAIDELAEVEIIVPAEEPDVVPAENSILTVIPVEPASSVQYQLITGSFQSSSNAQKQVAALINEGFTPEVIQAPNGFFRVCAIGCSDIQTAETKRKSVLAKFPETWILKNSSAI